MEVKYKDKTITLHYCHRIYVIFENLMSQEEANPDSQTAQTKLVYATLVATLKHLKIDDVITYDDTEELIDENGNMVFMAQFNKWFTECAEAEAELVRKLEILPVEKKQPQN